MHPTALSFSEIIKFNPYHDSIGQFSSSGVAASFTYKPGASTEHSKAIEREKEKAGSEKGFKGTLYHGSPNKDIKEFDMKRAGQNTSSGEKLLFFTDSKQMADDFSYERLEGSSTFFQQRGKKGRVYEVDVEMKNPLDLRKLSDKDIDNILKLDSDGILTKETVKQYANSNHQLLKAGLNLTSDSLKELGYDGLIANTGKAGHNSLEYAVVDSKQAKIRKSDDMALSFLDVLKFNPNHDNLGRFSSGSGGAAISIKNVVTGGFQGQTDAKLTAEIDGNVAGTLSYSEYEGEPHINMIETNPEYRGNGVATKMLQNLQSLYPGKNINTGMLTEDGSKLFEKVSEKVPNKEYSEVKRKLDSWKKELSRFESLSDEENANLSQKDGDRWNELYDLIEEGNTRLRGMREYDTFIKTTKSFNESNNNSSFQIAKADEDKRLVFGWALVSATSDGEQIIDHQGDIVDQDELEEGAYEYVLNFRDAGEEHIGTLRKKARMVESVVFTEEKLQAMGIPAGTVPYGWWIGFYVDDDDTWEKIKSGHYKMFSIEGKAVREPVDNPVTKSDNDDSGEIAKTFSELMKFNPYHGKDGRFVSGSGGNYASFTYAPGKSKAHDNAIAREKERMSSAGGSNSDNSSHATSNKIKQDFVDAGLNSKFKGVQRNAREGTGAYSFKDATPVSSSEALKMSGMQFIERNGKTLVHGTTDNKKVFYANNSDSKEIKALRQENERRKQKQVEDMKHRPDNINTTSTYDRWKKNHDKNFEAWFGNRGQVGKSVTFNEILKFNPYHDRLGRFATGGGFMSSGYIGDPNKRAVTFSANPNTRAGAMAIARASNNQTGHELIGEAYNNPKIPQKTTTETKPQTKKPQTKKPDTEPDNPMRPKQLAGVEPGEPMNFDQADHGSTNPNYSKGGGYYINCQTCVVANEARRRGYDVTARPKDTKQADEIARDQRKAWIDPKTGKHPDYMSGCLEVGTSKQAKKYLEDNLKTGERYTLGHAWKGRSRSGHIITAFKDDAGNVHLYDPQSGKKMSGSEVDSYLSRIKYKTSSYGMKFNIGFRILRVDDKQFNTDMVDKILTKGAA